MKKSLLFLATATIMVGCSSNEVLNEIAEKPIGFTKVYIENGTKAITPGAYTTDNFETVGNTFGVFGYKQTDTQTDALLFDNQAVIYQENLSTDAGYNATTDWAYSPIKYWDKEANAYNFYAYAPHDGDFTGTAELASQSETAFSISGFQQSHTQSTMIDLMTDLTSKKSVTGNAIGQNDVAFVFTHILSNINVEMAVSPTLKADNTANPVTIVSISLGEIKMDGSYAYATSAYAWTLAASSTTATFAGTQSGTSPNQYVFASDALNASNAASNAFTAVPALTDLLFVPQTVDNGYEFTIQYKIGTEVFDKTIPLSEFHNSSNQTLASWNSGYKYIYRIVIGPTPILFDLSGVSDWSDGGIYTYTVE